VAACAAVLLVVFCLILYFAALLPFEAGILPFLRVFVPVTAAVCFAWAFGRDRHDRALGNAGGKNRPVLHRFLLNVIALIILAYVAVTYALSRWDWFWGLVTAIVLPMAFALGVAFALPNSTNAWLRWRSQSVEAAAKRSDLLKRSLQLWPIVLLV